MALLHLPPEAITEQHLRNPVLDPARYPVLPEELLRHARVVPNRLAALSLWPKDAVIAEVGVALSEFSEAILNVCRPRRFLAIDRFDLHHLPALWRHPTAAYFGGRTHGDYYRDRFAREIATGRVEILEGDSAGVIAALPDESVDVFYVDADHYYEGVWRDLNAILPKIRSGGLIVMNDYIPAETGLSNEPYGVIQATNEFMVRHGWEMAYFALAYAMYCDVGLRKADPALAYEPPAVDARAAYMAMALLGPETFHRRNPADIRLIEAQEAEIARLETALRVMRQSTSWRLTAPLRALARRLGRHPSK